MSVPRSSYGQRALPAHTSYPRGHGGGTEDVEVGDTSRLTNFSIDGEYSSDTL
jgi:hypothetical protein